MQLQATFKKVPRHIHKWLESLDLAYAVKNPKHDLSNGFIVAEIMTRQYPKKEISINSYYNEMSLDKKRNNWEQVAKFMNKKDFVILPKEYEPIIFMAPNAAQDFLIRLYDFFLPPQKKAAKKKEEKKEYDEFIERPHQFMPTASLLCKDKELLRIVDNITKRKKVEETLAQHKEMKKEDHKKNQFAYNFRRRKKQQEQEEIRRRLEDKSKSKLSVTYEAQGPEVREIQVKSFHTASKDQNLFIEGREIQEGLAKICGPTFDKDPLQKEMAEMKVDWSKNSQTEYIFAHSNELSEEALKILIGALKEQIRGISEILKNSYSEFKIFFAVMMPTLENLNLQSEAYIQLCQTICLLGKELMGEDPSSSQTMLENLALEKFIWIMKKQPNKRDSILEIIINFCQNDSLAKLRMITKIKDLISNDLPLYLSILSRIVRFCVESEMDDELQKLLLYQVFCSNVLGYLNEPVTEEEQLFEEEKGIEPEQAKNLEELDKNISEVMKEREPITEKNEEKEPMKISKEEDKKEEIIKESPEKIKEVDDNEEDINFQSQKALQEEQLIKQIYKIFEEYSSENVLKVGLVYLAPILKFYPQLAERQLEILMKIPANIRQVILNTSETEVPEKNIVRGCNSFKQKTAGTPINWYSVGISKALEKQVNESKLEQLENVHLEILSACLFNPFDENACQSWIEIYDNLKKHIWLALCEKELCAIAGGILKKFLIFKPIENENFQKIAQKKGDKLLQSILVMIYHPDTDTICKNNFLEFLEFLRSKGENYKNMIYDVVKDYSETNMKAFLHSNLLNLMNSLAQERRGILNEVLEI